MQYTPVRIGRLASVFAALGYFALIAWLPGCQPAPQNQNTDDPAASNHGSHHQAAVAADPRAGYADSVNGGLISQDTLKGSPRRVTMANVGNCHVHIEYGSPGVKGRTIWGGLVAYQTVWAAGAHKATSIMFTDSLRVAGTALPPGKYGLFAIPGTDSFTLIINTRYQQHLADEYQPSEDLLRVTLKRQTLDKPVPRLTYVLQPKAPNAADLLLQWEHVQIALPLQAL
ncbi:MAG TPA: DUF2911 domain-containing protein [Phnomibacter sp.]|mgnify:CR=1 FL=1|nr:DUF2911 domain-containing protein [Phnomibacter sp.]